MKILSFLNVSNRQKIDADSGYIFFNILSPFFSQGKNSFTFVAPIPLDDPFCKHIPFELGDNKYAVRFNFPWAKIVNIINEEKPDVVIVNQIELIPNYKAVLETIGSKSIIVGYAHYIPFGIDDFGNTYLDPTLDNGGIGKSIKLSFMAGLLSADLIFTHSMTSLGLIKKLHTDLGIAYCDEKYIINPPPRDPKFVSTSNTPIKNKVSYNHRLYANYGGDFFVDLANLLTEKFAITLNVFDVLGERSKERKNLDPSVEIIKEKLSKISQVNIIDMDRKSYREELKESLFAIAPLRKNAVWSMSCIDAMGMGIPVIAPKIAWFDEFFPEHFKFDSLESAVSLVDKLLTDELFWEKASVESIKKTEELVPMNIANKFLDNFERILSKKQL